MEQRYSMGQVAKEAGVIKNTLAIWEEQGKIPKAPRERGGNHARVYSAELRAAVLKFARGRKELVSAEEIEPARVAPMAGKKK